MSYTYIYATLADIKKHCDKRVLVQLTNDDDQVDPTNEGNIDEGVLSFQENEAATTIDHDLRHVYDALPLTSPTPEIVSIAARLTWCNLWERRGDEPTQVTDLRRRLISRLKDMGKPDAEEVREDPRSQDMMPIRCTKGKARTMFDESGYFEGLPFPGRRVLPADRENRCI